MDVVTCNGCTFIFVEPRRVPKALPCGHAFCKKCMDQLEEIKNFLCPFCRQPWGEKVEDLVTNLTILELAKQPEYLDKALQADIDDEMACLKRGMDVVKHQLATGLIDPVSGLNQIRVLKERCIVVEEQEEKRKLEIEAKMAELRRQLAFLNALAED